MFTRIALVIGIGNYKDEPLIYSPPSAHAVFRMFVSEQHGQCDPNRSELITDTEEPITQESLDKIVKKCLSKTNNEETFIFYYCGHADTINDELFLLTNDTDETIDGYRISNLVMEIRDRNITKAILIIDACQSLVAFEAVGHLKGKLHKEIAFLVSCGRYQFGYQEPMLERSLFAYYFCEGIGNGCKGENLIENEIVDVITMKNYINKHISQNHPLYAKEQEAQGFIAEGSEKMWISKVPNSATSTPLMLNNNITNDVIIQLSRLCDLYKSGYLFPEKCEETINTLKAIHDSVKQYFQADQAVIDILTEQLSKLINNIKDFQNYCQDTTDYSIELRTNIVSKIQDLLGDLEFY